MEQKSILDLVQGIIQVQQDLLKDDAMANLECITILCKAEQLLFEAFMKSQENQLTTL